MWNLNLNSRYLVLPNGYAVSVRKEQLGPNVVCYLSPHESQILAQLKFQLVSINRGINIDLTLPPKTSAASLIG